MNAQTEVLMRFRRIALLASMVLFALSPRMLFGQQEQDTATYVIETLDGNEYVGKILFQDNDVIRLHTETLGAIAIPKAQIKSLTRVEQSRLKSGILYSAHPQSTRYFWSANGYGLKKGEGYYQNIWVLFNQVNYGISDRFSIGVGTMPLFLFAGAATPVWITPKFSIPIVRDKFNLGAGMLAGTVIGEDSGILAIVYGTGTLGDRDKNLSLGFGYAYGDGSWSRYPTFSLSGAIRTGPRGYLLSENYFFGGTDENVVVFSFGYRQMVRRTGIDFGLFLPTDAGTFLAWPLLGVSFPFGTPGH